LCGHAKIEAMRTGGMIVLLCGLALPLLFAVGGCGDACEDLEDVCNDCTDETYRNACQRDADDNVQSLCKNRLAFYRQQCPPPPPTTTTITVTSASTGGGMSAGGDGGMSAGGSG
jgi:hypothetical protein